MTIHTPRIPGRAAAAVVVALAAGCARQPEPWNPDAAFTLAQGEFCVAVYNLGRYIFDDRDGDGQRNNPKPAVEREAVAGLLANLSADVLALQGIGPVELFTDLIDDLERRGAKYPHRAHLLRPGEDSGLAVLSRFPIVEQTGRLDDLYRIGSTNLPVRRGFLDVVLEPAPGYRVRLITAHLKSKTFHPMGQTEMRRNEARLLANHVRRALRETPALNLMVAGDFGDTPESAPLKEILGGGDVRLIDIRPTDRAGDAWTHHSSGDDVYCRSDYILISPGLASEWAQEKTRIIRDPPAATASDHRPLVAVFRSEETRAPTLPTNHAPPSPSAATQ